MVKSGRYGGDEAVGDAGNQVGAGAISTLPSPQLTVVVAAECVLPRKVVKREGSAKCGGCVVARLWARRLLLKYVVTPTLGLA